MLAVVTATREAERISAARAAGSRGIPPESKD